MFERLTRRDSSNDLGPEHIIDAVYGNQSVTDIDEAVMGLPRLRDFGAEYFTDYYVVVPLAIEDDVDLSPFVFNVPEDPYLDGVLGELARFFNIETVEEIAGLEGQYVPVEWSEGYPQPDLNALRTTGSDE